MEGGKKMAQIELSRVCKRFTVYERPNGAFAMLRGAIVRKKRVVEALRDVSFSIGEGELVGYIGPNGSGKSTTVKVMSGILTPEEGDCRVLGRVPWRERMAHVASIGVVFGQRSQLWWDLPVEDSFRMIGDIYGVGRNDLKARREELCSLLGAGGLLSTPVRQLSLGQRMRCEVIASLLHAPRILFLDEPTIGLDAPSKLALREFLREENRRRGVTMILTTHDTADMEALCERVMVIGRGRLLYDGSLASLKKAYSPARVLTVSTGASSGGGLAEEAAALPGVLSARCEEGRLTVRFLPEQLAVPLLLSRLSERASLDDLTLSEESLEEMISSMYREMAI